MGYRSNPANNQSTYSLERRNRNETHSYWGTIVGFSCRILRSKLWSWLRMNLLHCKGYGAETCWHEIGHFVDEQRGYPSQSIEFARAVQFYVVFKIKTGNDLDGVNTIFNTPGIFTYSSSYQVFGREMFSSPQAELYANIFADAQGEIEKIDPLLRPFYIYEHDYQTTFDKAMSKSFITIEE
jgi:hypothetical protein